METPTGGELNAAISNFAMRLHREYVGRGPTRVRTFHRENVVVIVLEDPLTRAERNLVGGGERELVLKIRSKFQWMMRDQLVAEVERLTGRRVQAFLSDNHFDPDLAVEVLVLDKPIGGD